MIEGTVIATSHELCSLELDNDFVVYLPHLVISTGRLPRTGDRVRLGDHYHRPGGHPKVIFLCDKSTMEHDNLTSGMPYRPYLPDVVEKYRLGVSDLLNVNVHRKIIEDRLVKFTQQSVEYVVVFLIDVLGDLLHCVGDVASDACSRMSLPKYSLQTVSDCRYVDDKNHQYKDFPYWSYGVHNKTADMQILIGYFYIDKTTGLPFIKDKRRRIPCCVTRKNNQDLLEYTDLLVLIKEYKVFTEVFNQDDIVPLEYLLFKLEDVRRLDMSMRTTVPKLRKSKPEMKYNFKFILVKKGMVMRSSNNSPECWLKVFIVCGDELQPEYLAVSSTYLEVAALFDVGSAYEVFHNERMLTYYCKEMQHLERLPCRLLSEKSAIFVKNHTTVPLRFGFDEWRDDKEILTIDDVMKTSKKTFSFEGVIHSKEFVEPIESRTTCSTVAKGFGTPGRKTHVLHFISAGNTRLVLYLNNWERLLVPLGLLPNMRVLVRNVVLQKNRYLKSTALTTFTVLRYEAADEIVSMNLYAKRFGDGRISGLHAMDLIPPGIVVSARVSKITFRTIKLKCNTGVSLTFLAKDHCGETLMKSKSLSVLQTALGLKNVQQWNKFLDAVEVSGGFDYCAANNKHVLHETIRHVIAASVSLSFANSELYCVRIKESPNGFATCFCIGGRLL